MKKVIIEWNKIGVNFIERKLIQFMHSALKFIIKSKGYSFILIRFLQNKY